MFVDHQVTQQEYVEDDDTGAFGPTGDWVDIETLHCRVLPFSAVAKARYQGIDSSWSHQLEFHGVVTCSLRDRFIWVTNGNKILIPKHPPEDPDVSGMTTLIIVEDTGEVLEDGD